jgi:hypothetical protein
VPGTRQTPHDVNKSQPQHCLAYSSAVYMHPYLLAKNNKHCHHSYWLQPQSCLNVTVNKPTCRRSSSSARISPRSARYAPDATNSTQQTASTLPSILRQPSACIHSCCHSVAQCQRTTNSKQHSNSNITVITLTCRRSSSRAKISPRSARYALDIPHA